MYRVSFPVVCSPLILYGVDGGDEDGGLPAGCADYQYQGEKIMLGRSLDQTCCRNSFPFGIKRREAGEVTSDELLFVVGVWGFKVTVCSGVRCCFVRGYFFSFPFIHVFVLASNMSFVHDLCYEFKESYQAQEHLVW